MQKKTILFIGFTWPEPASTAAGNRIVQLLHYFLERNYRVIFSSTASETPLSLNLEAIGVEKVNIALNDASFDDLIKVLVPQIVIFDRFLTEEQFGWRVAAYAPSALRVLDTEDLHSLRVTRETLFKKNIPFTTEHWLTNDTTKREIASIYRCDLSLIISSYEMYLLTDILKIDAAQLLHLPFMLNAIEENTFGTYPSYEERKDFICIGNGKHAPNVDAILWLKKEIWPRIKAKLPDANLHIYGAYLPQHVQQMDDPKQGFRIMGWAENAEKVLKKARVGLAPLRFGAGIKGKLVDAMQAGTPTVTTSIGAEGMDLISIYPTTTQGVHQEHKYGWSGKIANTADDFAKAAVSLYNKKEWQEAQLKAVALINGIYDKRFLGQKFDHTLTEIQSNLQTHRNQNFIGSMVMHHSLASTKYMAKWIEAKNQNK
ncbi:hypothetical protein LCGC14_1525800 [marine sediment metagenome]|uniref:Glycosyltransferase n=2 Tax=root TaxID=1 RepID=A0A831QVC2_9FLAO|nr:glycosyltransferase [Pricia antarctica]